MSGLVTPTGLLSRLVTPTGTKGGPFVRVGGSTRDKKPLSPTLARLAVGPGIKATFCPGPKGNRDKWPGRKAYFVVVHRIVGWPFIPTDNYYKGDMTWSVLNITP